ncbi:superoxide dismutase [candidate division WOR_3 bacterium SM23_42]|uniref:Superoxide dismutase n=1 Tax=candidate division WOR_3 bacterium SM23_42 TaxID=1703779 RepID=A0A0S8FVB3_UNCW3|nr:MAG: superoxide dismutase [candidate division WOR_3 bacterium SM23_42]
MHRMSARHVVVAVLPLLMVMGVNTAFAHCEIPCGIYDDEMRFEMIVEHIVTVEKSMNMILTLIEQERIDHNQLVRWINNKESHADEIQDIVCQYFMTQRIKPVEKGEDVKYITYVKQITLLHHMLIIAMKMKQTTDLTTAEKFRSLLEEFRAVYFGGKK